MAQSSRRSPASKKPARRPSKRPPRKPAAAPKPQPAAAGIHTRLPSVWQLSAATGRLLWRGRRPLGGVVAIYGLLCLLLVHGPAGTTLSSQLSQSLRGHTASASAGLSALSLVVGSSSGSSSTAGTSAYQLMLLVIGSLAIIFVLRQLEAAKPVRVKSAFYSGMYPLIPFVLLLILLGIELLPLVLGSSLYSLVSTTGIAVHLYEKIAWAALALLLAAWTFYLVTSSLFALYIVTLPQLTPRTALRSAKQLIRGRRWQVLRKLLYLPLAVLLIIALITFPVLALSATAAAWVAYLLSIVALPVVHAYLYSLYRALLPAGASHD